jgi:hypothetical protein
MMDLPYQETAESIHSFSLFQKKEEESNYGLFAEM